MQQFLLDLLAFSTILSSILVITSKNPVISVVFLISVFINAAGYLLILGIGFIGISYLILYVGAITVLFLFVIMLINIRLTDILETGSQYTKNLPLAFSIGSLFIFAGSSLITNSFSQDINNSHISLLSVGGPDEKQHGNILLDTLNRLNDYFRNFFLTPNTVPTDNYTIISDAEVKSQPLVSSTASTSGSDVFISKFLQIETLGQYIYTYGSLYLIITSMILLLALSAPIFISRRQIS